MSYNQSLAAICFEDVKTAALYFDRVLPISFRKLYGTGAGMFCDFPEPIEVGILGKLVFGAEAERHQFLNYVDNHWIPLINQTSALRSGLLDSNVNEAYDEIKELYLRDESTENSVSVRNVFQDFAKSIGINSFSVLLPSERSNTTFEQAYTCLAVNNLPLVDTKSASWEQIMEIRADADAHKLLRRLRLFLYENYREKSSAYIEDDLLRRLDDYERARKKHGFDAVNSSISILLDSNTLQAAIIAGLTSAIFGGPLVGLSAGAAVELGKVLINVRTKSAEIRNLADGHDLAFIIRAQDQLNP